MYYLVKIGQLVALILTGALGLMLELHLIHNWWPFVPSMGYVTAFQLVTVSMIILVMAAMINAIDDK